MTRLSHKHVTTSINISCLSNSWLPLQVYTCILDFQKVENCHLTRHSETVSTALNVQRQGPLTRGVWAVIGVSVELVSFDDPPRLLVWLDEAFADLKMRQLYQDAFWAWGRTLRTNELRKLFWLWLASCQCCIMSLLTTAVQRMYELTLNESHQFGW